MKLEDCKVVLILLSLYQQKYFHDNYGCFNHPTLFKGVNVVMANENPDLNEYISMVPTSAFLGDGIGNIIAHIVNDSQNRLAEKLAYCEELECTVMEVRKII